MTDINDIVKLLTPEIIFPYMPGAIDISAEKTKILKELREYWFRIYEEMKALQKRFGKTDREAARFFKEESAEAMKHYRAACFLIPNFTSDHGGDCELRVMKDVPSEIVPYMRHIEAQAECLGGKPGQGARVSEKIETWQADTEARNRFNSVSAKVGRSALSRELFEVSEKGRGGMTNNTEDVVITGTGDVFADLGLHVSEDDMWKISIAHAISSVVTKCGYTQERAGEIMGIDQPKVSKLLRGRLKEFSDRMIEYLLRLGYDVEVRLQKTSGERGTVRLVA